MKEGISEVRMILTNDDTVIIKKGAVEDFFRVRKITTVNPCAVCDLSDGTGRCIIRRAVECRVMIGQSGFLQRMGISGHSAQPSLPDELL